VVAQVWFISATAAAIGGPLKFFLPHAKYQMHETSAKATNTTEASVGGGSQVAVPASRVEMLSLTIHRRSGHWQRRWEGEQDKRKEIPDDGDTDDAGHRVS
jgi:hypothetical protein